MGIGYATAYRAGIIPWEKAGRLDQPTLLHLLQLVYLIRVRVVLTASLTFRDHLPPRAKTRPAREDRTCFTHGRT